MIKRATVRLGLAIALALMLVAGITVLSISAGRADRRTIVAYFANSNGIFVGDEVRILGVRVGKIDRIEPQPEWVKITFWYDAKYPVPADAKAVILSPAIVTARIIQLTPAYTGGPQLADNAVIPQDRTAVPVEWDDLRQQLERLTELVQPTEPGGVSTLGSVVHTTAETLRGQGATLRQTIIELSQAVSLLGDHSDDVFGTLKNLSLLVSALRDSGQVMRELNTNLASATALLSNDPNEIGDALSALDAVIGDVRSFVADNRDALGVTADKLASVSAALGASLDDIKQALHVTPNALQNLMNTYQPAQATMGGAYAFNNFADPITFLCGAIQAASRMSAEQSAKLCVQYLAPIVKNRQYNFPPLAENLIVGATARPNEVTYSEDWLRPDYVPPPEPAVRQMDPAQGLSGMMMPAEVGS
ncbi:MCE family protein [Mycobacterium crocinum]|uniref:MCE family protein n=1 Tax=Mycolicibacterium crocinum TaxID=388459 RepID=A0ABY3TKX1_9MYCO|nr:MCE family protein [Mycolicibacterium crocinum]MCV7214692.1 MCE family protein [Mycolicibacterium crocinum]ULN41620.1 MCE family protein [Mycolicibacterium crocinum]